ncbi:hypothetical protein J8L85_10210 [Maribacter sp. MMG018]|uniref:hypothetical protein n=1 Tax=Maribacter sp. MMG018 TaxID=2822688 RepID=UPI001B35E950|nr:hypothetical protein [Maribacter sp. MMG018]MBQ4914810.1 hypothetical protein [Maribacter sp. MMG018]
MNKLLSLALLLLTVSSYSQDKSKERIRTLKVAFITERLDLTPEEAQEFWPVYNGHEEKREALRKKKWIELRSKFKDAGALSEKEAQNLLDKYIKIEEEEEELDKVYLKEVSKVISAKKTLILMRSEDDFKRQLIKQYRKNKGGR